MNITPFNDIIRGQRLHKKLPLRKVAAYIDIDPSTLSKIERNERFASRNLIKPLAEVLELDHDQLMTAYLSDQVVAMVCQEHNSRSILQVAEQKIHQQDRATV